MRPQRMRCSPKRSARHTAATCWDDTTSRHLAHHCDIPMQMSLTNRHVDLSCHSQMQWNNYRHPHDASAWSRSSAELHQCVISGVQYLFFIRPPHRGEAHDASERGPLSLHTSLWKDCLNLILGCSFLWSANSVSKRTRMTHRPFEVDDDHFHEMFSTVLNCFFGSLLDQFYKNVSKNKWTSQGKTQQNLSKKPPQYVSNRYRTFGRRMSHMETYKYPS